MGEKKVSVFAKHKSKFILLLLSISITAVWTGLLVRHYRNPNPHSLIANLENKLLDLRFRLRGSKEPTSKIAILAIDEKSLQKFGRWPFARKHYEKLFTNLKKLGAGWVGLDIVWSEPERPLLEDVASEVQKLAKIEAKDWKKAQPELKRIEEVMGASLGDQAIARAFKNYKKVVLGYAYYGTQYEAEQLGENPFRGIDTMLNSAIQALIIPDGFDLSHYSQFEAFGLSANTEFVSAAAEHFAFFNNELSADGIFRWLQLVRNINGNLMPTLALKMAAQITGREPVIFFDQLGITEVSLVNPNDDKDILKIPVDMDGRGRMLLNHLGPRESIEHVSLADLYDLNFTPAQKKRFKGTNFLVGPTAVGINDLRANPFDAGFDGVEQHATALDNILSSSFMRREESMYLKEIGVMAMIFVVFTPLMIFAKAAMSALAVIAFLAGYYYLDKHLWFGHGEWVFMGVPFLQVLSTYVGTTLYKYITEERERKKVKGAFGLYLSPDVINQVLDDPSALKLGGDKKELTVFFSDVRSFTTISESLTPEKLCELMNDYFTPMTSIILRSGGVLDKYIGDAIMAFWGAPVTIPNHPDVAAESAVKMLFALDQLRVDLPKKGFPVIDIGIGLNTGMMSVGNMGSGERFCYTVMGDSVNLGARLEGLTKEYGIKIMISEFTQRRLTRKDLYTRDLDDIRVKGKLEPVKVFDLMRPDILKTEREIRDLIGEFELGRKAYRTQNWEAAKKHFLSCLTIRPDDGPSTLYLERIEEKSQSPAIPDWDGVYTFKHK